MTLLSWRRGGAAGAAAAVLLHGWARGADVWDAWHDDLGRAGLAALACDLPGHSGSAEFEAPDGTDLARWSAHAVSRDLVTLGVSEAHLVGFAEGGMVAAHTALAVAVRRTVLIEPDLDWPLAHAAEAAAALRDPRARLWSTEASDLVARARTTGGTGDRRTLAAWLMRATWPSAARLRAVRGPVLVVVGSESPHRQAGRRLAALLGDGRVATVGGTADAVIADRATRDLVARFLTESAR